MNENNSKEIPASHRTAGQKKAGNELFRMIDEIRASVQAADAEELDATIAEAVQAAKKGRAERSQ